MIKRLPTETKLLHNRMCAGKLPVSRRLQDLILESVAIGGSQNTRP